MPNAEETRGAAGQWGAGGSAQSMRCFRDVSSGRFVRATHTLESSRSEQGSASC